LLSTTMAGPGLEVFKFSLYLLLPVGVMIHISKPEWYTQNVLPYKQRIFPPLENTVQRLPAEQSALREELARIKAEKLEKKRQREERSSD